MRNADRKLVNQIRAFLSRETGEEVVSACVYGYSTPLTGDRRERVFYALASRNATICGQFFMQAKARLLVLYRL